MMLPIRNRNGDVQLDNKGKPILEGQPVLIMDTVYSKGCRGSVSLGVAVGFDRQVIVLPIRQQNGGQYDTHMVEKMVQFYRDKSQKLFKLKDHEEWKLRGLENSERVSACYLIATTDAFVRGWATGSIFE